MASVCPGAQLVVPCASLRHISYKDVILLLVMCMSSHIRFQQKPEALDASGAAAVGGFELSNVGAESQIPALWMSIVHL